MRALEFITGHVIFKLRYTVSFGLGEEILALTFLKHQFLNLFVL